MAPHILGSSVSRRGPERDTGRVDGDRFTICVRSAAPDGAVAVDGDRLDRGLCTGTVVTRPWRNVIRLPRRTVASLWRRAQPVYRFQRRANRYTCLHLSPQTIDRLAAVPGNTSDRQCRLLFYMAMNTPAAGVLMEIGAYMGKSTAWLAEAARRGDRHLISIDPHLNNSYDAFQRTLTEFNIEQVATIHRAASHEVGKTFETPIGLLWVDGGHEYECVRQDIADFGPHVRPGGFAIFDDADPKAFPGVVRAIDETLHCDPTWTYLGRVKTMDLWERRNSAGATKGWRDRIVN